MIMFQDKWLTGKAFLKAGAGLATLASPLCARGVALARYSDSLACRPLDSINPVTLRFYAGGNLGSVAFFKAAGAAFTASPRYATSLAFALEQGNVAMHFDSTWSFASYPHYPVTKWQQGNIDIVPFLLGT